MPCCLDYEGKIELGNMNNNTIKEIWFGDKYNEFRNQLLNNKKKYRIM